MCLAVPAKVIEKEEMLATVEVGGVRREVSLMLLPEAMVGQFVLIHAGFAVQMIDAAEAEATTAFLKELTGIV